MAQELEARLVGPVQVVEHENHGTLVAGCFEKSHDRGIEEVPLGVGVGRLRSGELPETLTEGGHQSGKLRTVGSHVCA